MDAAVIEVASTQTENIGSPIWSSSVIGFKPVRMITGRGLEVDAQVVERIGTVGPTIFAEPREEPPYPAHLVLDRYLDHGDSGCLIVDCEFANRSQELPPYMIYLGKMHLAWGLAGYGLMLEQPKTIWDLEFLDS